MFDVDSLVASCVDVLGEAEPRAAVRQILTRALERPDEVAAAIGKSEGGLEVLYGSVELTILNVVWAPRMSIYPHDHRMWAAIGIYTGIEDNTLFRRSANGIVRSGRKELRSGDVLLLGADAIHSVDNPIRAFTGAIHIYGGDFVNQPRSQWDPDTRVEHTYDPAQVRRLFADANAAWAAQLNQDLDVQVE